MFCSESADISLSVLCQSKIRYLRRGSLRPLHQKETIIADLAIAAVSELSILLSASQFPTPQIAF
jgi:hypothetical protein